MMKITGGYDCTTPGDYVAWDEMKWSMVGSVETYHEQKICKEIDKWQQVFTATFTSWCMNFCPKIPETKTLADIRMMDHWYKETLFDPNTPLPYPGILTRYWGSYSDEDLEGVFVDFYNNNKLDQDTFVPGQPNGGTGQNCVDGLTSFNGSFYDTECYSSDPYTRATTRLIINEPGSL